MKVKLVERWRWWEQGETVEVEEKVGQALLEKNIAEPVKNKMVKKPGKSKGIVRTKNVH